jgi:MGT family glycosyltransferase
MSRFLFTVHPEQGHISGLLAIATALRSRGHDVLFASSVPKHTPPAVGAAGFPLAPLRPSLAMLRGLLIPFFEGFRETRFAMQVFSAGLEHYARAIGRVISEWAPDVVVSDCTFAGAMLAAEWRGVPFAAVYHTGLSFPGPGIPPFGSGLPIGEVCDDARVARYRRQLERVQGKLRQRRARARARLGIAATAPASSFLERPVSPWLNLVLSSEACEAPRDPLPETTFFVGPCITSSGTHDFPLEQLRADVPKVYASLGTVFNNRPRVFRATLDACADGRYQLIVSAGQAYARLHAESQPPHHVVRKSVPQVALLPQVDVVVSHGGNNTVNETLAAGKPLLVMPVGGEQADNAARVVYLGAGLRADLHTVTAHDIRGALDRLLSEAQFQRRAAEIAVALARTDGPGIASQFIERLARTRAPVRRPAGYPLTVTRDLALPR